MQYHTNTWGVNDPALAKALKQAISTASSNGSNEVLILVHSLDMLHGALESVLGALFMKAFLKDRVAKSGNVTVFLETERVTSQFKSGVIFCPHISTKLLQGALSDYRQTDIVYVPWAESELAEYIKMYPTSVEV